MSVISFRKGNNNSLTKNFKLNEFECHCTNSTCGGQIIDKKLLLILQEIRDDLNLPITINSAYRCSKHNSDIGGSQNSQHILGKAVDIRVRGMTPEEVQEYLIANFKESLTIGRYNSFTHIDVRNNPIIFDKR